MVAELSGVGTAVMGDDTYLWLEDIRDGRALDWVRRRNKATLAQLSGERFERMRAEALEVADSSDRIPSVKRRGEYLYNFWIDAEHPRGLWRRTTLDEYRKDCPDWDVLVDVDALAAAEDENWVLQSVDVIEPEYTRALISLSRGGSDASTVREFDMVTREFVADGFTLPEARNDTSWEDENTVLVATDFGDGSMSEAGFPLVIKRWRRGTPLDEAETVFTGSGGDLAVFAGVDRTPGYQRTAFMRQLDNRHRETLFLRDGELVRLDVPSDAPWADNRQWLVISLTTDWVRGDTTYKGGAVLVTDFEEFLAGTAELRVVFEPDARTFFQAAVWTKDHLLVLSLQDVASRLEVITPGTWDAKPIPGVPDNTDTGIHATDSFSNEIFLVSTGFDKPPRLLHGLAGESVCEIKPSPARFNADDLVVSQHFATSVDGTRIPYFLVAHRDSTGPGPTLLGGYGGFAISQTPGYLSVCGRLWLARGGTYALANIRGGAEYGPDWYLQSIRAGRHKVAEDFAAVATDLIDRGVTTAPQLAATGASAGGLLMGVMLTQYPELFGALVCRQPVLDMRRFPALGAGAAVIAEYGNPDDPADWEFIQQYSPYHNIRADRTYPPILITTSANDDRVHPAHARKMAATLQDAGHSVLFYENTEGGHAGVSNNAQAAFESALMYEFLHSTVNP
jgi:prolyl oligopeptidase